MQNVAQAKVSYVRISPRKMKIVIDLVRNKPVGTALAILKHTPKAAAPVVEKLILSAMANAENNHGMDVEKLYVAEIFSNAGPMLKRIQPRAQGRAFRILKRTSHTTVVLKELGAEDAPAAEKPEKKEPKKGGKAKKAEKAETKPAEAAEAKAEEAAEKPAKKTTAAKKPAAKKPAAKKAEGGDAPAPKKPRTRKKAETAEEKPAEEA